jgi:SAM-dependent methyltransferase
MIDVARRSTESLGLENATFGVGDATDTGLPPASFDGAASRFAIHHIPAPGRLVGELARVVRPGGRVVLADHAADPDLDAFMWSQEIERLRDPSHWMSLPAERLRELGAAAGLSLESETVMPFRVDFEDWLARGSGGPGARRLIERRLGERPAGSGCFRVTEVDGNRSLELTMWLSLWRR